MNDILLQERLKDIMSQVKTLATEYYSLTQKPLGVTGEIAEYVAAELMNLELASARTRGYDAIRHTEAGPVRIQIKGRAFGDKGSKGQRLGIIKSDAPCDIVMVVLLDNKTLDAHEIWEAPFSAVTECLARPGSRSRERGALGVAEFIRIAQCTWRAASRAPKGQPSVLASEEKSCPECGQVFKAGTWGGIDAHWRSQHDHIMLYEHAWPLISAGDYHKQRAARPEG